MIPDVTVPEGTSGDWKVQRFVVTEEDAKFANLRAALGHSRERVRAGTYTSLTRNGFVVMSDTPQEKRDHAHAVYEAWGNMLVSGLGLGMVAQACLLKPSVTHLTVIEIEPDVISLVAPHYQQMFGDRFEVVQADIFKWKPAKGTRYTMIWHDVWNEVCGDNWPEMVALKRRFQHCTSWQHCWCEAETRYNHRGS